MPYEQEFALTSTLDADKLRNEISAILASVDVAEARQITAADYTVSQKAGTGLEPVLIAFASKVAYDIWREIILPRLKVKFGGAAAAPRGELRATSGNQP